MRIVKYIIFFSILSGIFFVIYLQSDQKGFSRWRTSFKAAALKIDQKQSIKLLKKYFK